MRQKCHGPGLRELRGSKPERSTPRPGPDSRARAPLVGSVTGVRTPSECPAGPDSLEKVQLTPLKSHDKLENELGYLLHNSEFSRSRASECLMCWSLKVGVCDHPFEGKIDQIGAAWLPCLIRVGLLRLTALICCTGVYARPREFQGDSLWAWSKTR